MLRFMTLSVYDNTLLSLATSYELKIPSDQDPHQANASMRTSSDKQKKISNHLLCNFYHYLPKD